LGKKHKLIDSIVEALHCIERPNVSADFGTAFPPSGINGIIRQLKKQIENQLLLLLSVKQ